MKTLGVIGGMGPAATANFYGLFVRLFDARTDQENPDVIILSLPSIPDRTAFILGKSTSSPVFKLRQAAETLENLGVHVVAIPCVTAHYFYEDVAKNLNIPILHMIKETTDYVASSGAKRAGLLATAGTVQSGMFQRELLARGIETVVPQPETQARLMALLYTSIKANKTADMREFYDISAELRRGGAELIILGCTELFSLRMEHPLSAEYVDALEILARRAVIEIKK